MSLCDHCYNPGACCRMIRFYGGEGQFPFWLDEHVPRQLSQHLFAVDHEAGRPNPFRAQAVTSRQIDEETGRPYGDVTFSCVNLLPNGRCGDYAHRPELCRVYVPAMDPTCAHYGGAEAGDYVGDEMVEYVLDRVDFQ